LRRGTRRRWAEKTLGGRCRRKWRAARAHGRDHERASQALLTRIMKLHMAGRSPEEIAVQVLTTEPENVVFRAALMIEIILHDARRAMEERAL
jgi:hypothetical protein